MNLRFIFFTLVLLSLSQILYGQTDTTRITQMIEVMPKYKSGEQEMLKVLSDSLVYPETAKRNRIGGRVLTQFTIDSLGNVLDVKVVEGLTDDINQEAIRIIKLLKDWTPATQNGRKVNVVYKMPIIFYPDSKFKRKYKRKHHLK